MNDAAPVLLDNADWPLFGWQSDVRPALAAALGAGRPVALATLFHREGSAPRGPGTQMLFDGSSATGYFSGDCIEADVARHAAATLADGEPRRLVYGIGSPWIDIRLRCGGGLHILVERIAADCAAAHAVVAMAKARRACLWQSNGREQEAGLAQEEPGLSWQDDPLRIARRYDPPRRMLVSGGDPIALAIARLASEAGLETVLVRPDGPEQGPPVKGVGYICAAPLAALEHLGPDRWTAFVGATHEDVHDLPACAAALTGGAGYVGLIGAFSRIGERRAGLATLGIGSEALENLHMPAGLSGVGKAPWEVAVSVLAEAMQIMNRAGIAE